MADVDLAAADVQARGIELTDRLVGVTQADTDAADAFGTALVSAFIADVYENPPASLTVAQQTALRALIGIATALADYATLADPTFTGVPAVPTAATGTDTTQAASTAFVAAAVAAALLAGGSDGVLSTAVFDDATDEIVLTLSTGTVLRIPIMALVAGLAQLTGATFTGDVSGITPTAAAHLTRKDYVDTADGLRALLTGATFTGAVSGITPTAVAHLTRKDYVDTAIGLRALLAGATFTGTTGGIDPVNDTDFVTKSYADTHYTGGGTVTTHELWAGWSADTTVTATEVLAGASSDTDTVTLPNATGSQYLWVWRADDDGGDPTEVHIAGGGNQRNLFGTATALTVDSVPGQLIVTVTTANADFLSAENLRIV